MTYEKIALAATSNALPESERENIHRLKTILCGMGLQVIESPYIYGISGGAAGTARERAGFLNACFRDITVDAVFDISGGDMANEVLPFLDYGAIADSRAVFWGYSDLTTVINAIYAKTGRGSVLYQIRHLVRDETGLQTERFRDFLHGGELLFETVGSAPVVGGNIRCFLKLAGTPYFPKPDGKILFLESLGGTVPQISTYMAQLHQLGVFAQVRKVILGTFTQMERERCTPAPYEILQPYLPEGLPVIQTGEVGHDCRAKALRIGGDGKRGCVKL